jgi:tryptophanyl-tRNA synthetase
MRLDPWGSANIADYEDLIKEFGMQRMPRQPELDENPYYRRNIVFGHRDFDKWLADFKARKPVSILTGLMPSGPMHLGHKMVVDQVRFWQDKGVRCRVLIADIEAQNTRRLTPDQTKSNAVNEYLVNYVALGLDPKKTEFYAQSNRSVPYYAFAGRLASRTTLAEMKDIYGELTPGKITSALLQMADILHPQLPEYEGPQRVLVPVGVDQDPHLRLARDMAEREGLVKPSSTYHRFMTGLDGGKMSSSRPESFLGMNDSLEVVSKKVRSMLTGGRSTWEEQKKLGGEADKCPKFELDTYHFILEDKDLKKIYSDCYGGKIPCGDCKAITVKRIEDWWKSFEKKKSAARKTVEKLDIFPSKR